MSSQKCPDCGLINWSDATNCKRCNAPFGDMNQAADDYVPDMQLTFQGEKPQTVLGVLMIIWGILMLAAGLFLLSFGPVSPAVVGGPIFAISGILVMRDRAGAMGLYFLGLAVMVLWLGAAQNMMTAIGCLFYAGLVGLLVMKRRLPVLAGIMMGFSCLALVGVLLIVVLLKPGQVAWRDFRPNQGLFTVKMPSEPSAPESAEEKRGAYSMTKHMYISSVAGQGSVLYGIVDYSPALPTDRVSYDEMLDAEVNNLISRSSSTLVSKHATTVSGYSGVEFEMKPPDNLRLASPKCFVKMFMNSEHMYVLQITASESSELFAGKETFLNPEFSYRSSR
jgi:hypothetical protein